VFSELQSHYLFADRLGRPGKGNDKGKVEGRVGWIRRNYLVPLPRAASLDTLNERLVEDCHGSAEPADRPSGFLHHDRGVRRRQSMQVGHRFETS
jgi:transposase